MTLSINGKTYAADELIAYHKRLEKENELLKADLEFSAKMSSKNKQAVKEYQKLVSEYSSEGADLQDRIKKFEKENALVKSLLYCTKETCDNCGFVNCENFQRQRKSEPCSLYVPYQVRIKNLAHESDVLRESYNNSEMTLAFVSDRLAKAEELLLELYDCIPSSMADSCKETLQKVALFFKDSEVEK